MVMDNSLALCGARAAETARGNAAGVMETRVKRETLEKYEAEPARGRSRCNDASLELPMHAAVQNVKLAG
jgi:hypothetical protein